MQSSKCVICEANAAWGHDRLNPSHCYNHRENHMVNSRTGLKSRVICCEAGCGEYAMARGNSRSVRCVHHQRRIKHPTCCTGCGRPAFFNTVGSSLPRHCSVHRLEEDKLRFYRRKRRGRRYLSGYIDLTRRVCEVVGCVNYARTDRPDDQLSSRRYRCRKHEMTLTEPIVEYIPLLESEDNTLLDPISFY